MVRFGPSGNCDLFYELGYKDSEEAPKWLNSMGLTAYEYGFTLGRFLTPEKSKKLLDEAKKYDKAHDRCGSDSTSALPDGVSGHGRSTA